MGKSSFAAALLFLLTMAGCAKSESTPDSENSRPRSTPRPQIPGTESVEKRYACATESTSRPLGEKFELKISADGETATVRTSGLELTYKQRESGIDSSSDYLVFDTLSAEPAFLEINGWMVQSIEPHDGKLITNDVAYACQPTSDF